MALGYGLRRRRQKEEVSGSIKGLLRREQGAASLEETEHTDGESEEKITEIRSTVSG